MRKQSKAQKALMFFAFVGFAIIIRTLGNLYMGETANIKWMIVGGVIVLISVYFSRRLTSKESE